MNASTFKESLDQFDKRNKENYPEAAEYPLFVVEDEINNCLHLSTSNSYVAAVFFLEI